MHSASPAMRAHRVPVDIRIFDFDCISSGILTVSLHRRYTS